MTVVSEEFVVQVDEVELWGYRAWDAANKELRPLVLVYPSVCGRTPYDIEVADRLAAMGYVGVAVDIYGDRWHTMELQRRRREAFERQEQLLSDRRLFRRRIQSLWNYCLNFHYVDIVRTATIGFGLGGLAALELVRAGGAPNAVVSFYGIRVDEQPLGPLRAWDLGYGGVSPQVLLLHAERDSVTSLSEVEACRREFQEAIADANSVMIMTLEGVGHGFAHPVEGGSHYNLAGAGRAWMHMSEHLQRALDISVGPNYRSLDLGGITTRRRRVLATTWRAYGRQLGTRQLAEMEREGRGAGFANLVLNAGAAFGNTDSTAQSPNLQHRLRRLRTASPQRDSSPNGDDPKTSNPKASGLKAGDPKAGSPIGTGLRGRSQAASSPTAASRKYPANNRATDSREVRPVQLEVGEGGVWTTTF